MLEECKQLLEDFWEWMLERGKSLLTTLTFEVPLSLKGPHRMGLAVTWAGLEAEL